MLRLIALVLLCAGCETNAPAKACVGFCEYGQTCERDNEVCTCMSYGLERRAWRCDPLDMSASVDLRVRPDLRPVDGMETD